MRRRGSGGGEARRIFIAAPALFVHLSTLVTCVPVCSTGIISEQDSLRSQILSDIVTGPLFGASSIRFTAW